MTREEAKQKALNEGNSKAASIRNSNPDYAYSIEIRETEFNKTTTNKIKR